IEDAAGKDDTKYSLGSVLNHVLMHQTIIGQEALTKLGRAGAMPDLVVGCVGGGSNFSGLAFPFLRDRLTGHSKTRFLAVEPAACPSMTRGKYAYDFGDTIGMTPLLEMYTLGHTFIPEGIHAGGLRYHGMAPLVSALAKHGFIEPVAYPQRAVFDAAVQFARTEGTIPAPDAWAGGPEGSFPWFSACRPRGRWPPSGCGPGSRPHRPSDRLRALPRMRTHALSLSRGPLCHPCSRPAALPRC